MPYFFDVYGPFDVARERRRITRSQPELWSSVRDADVGLDTAIGCYMFCLRHGSSVKPWYVGKTLAANGFLGEAFTPHKLLIYNDCLDHSRGRPQLFFFPMMTGNASDSGRFSHNRSQGKKIVGWLEKTLMGMALRRNADLRNIADTSLPRGVTVRGLMGEQRCGRPFAEVVDVRRALLA